MSRLLVNVDHIATLRNARGEAVPDPTYGARLCEEAGAAGIVFHLREDRRHIRDADVKALKKTVKGILDFEMAATDEMIRISLETQPHLVTLVPEKRMELTTEGGLNMEVVFEDYQHRVMPHYKGTGIEVSLFLDPVLKDIEAAAKLGVEAVELHTGTYALAKEDEVSKELDRLAQAAEWIHQFGMKVNAGHGLNLQNLPNLLRHVPHLHDVSIGHAIMAEAIFLGLPEVVRRYLALMNSHA